MAKPETVKKSPISETPINVLDKPKKAFTLERVKDGWVFVTYTYKDGQLSNIERTEPDLKIVAVEKFKIASFKYWSRIG